MHAGASGSDTVTQWARGKFVHWFLGEHCSCCKQSSCAARWFTCFGREPWRAAIYFCFRSTCGWQHRTSEHSRHTGSVRSGSFTWKQKEVLSGTTHDRHSPSPPPCPVPRSSCISMPMPTHASMQHRLHHAAAQLQYKSRLADKTTSAMPSQVGGSMTAQA